MSSICLEVTQEALTLVIDMMAHLLFVILVSVSLVMGLCLSVSLLIDLCPYNKAKA